MAYEKKIRQLVIAYKDSGHTFAQVQEAFGVGPKRYYAWKKQFRETNSFNTNYPSHHEGKFDDAKLMALVEKHPDWYLREYAEELNVSVPAVHKRLAKLKITRKKKLSRIAKSLLKNARSI